MRRGVGRWAVMAGTLGLAVLAAGCAGDAGFPKMADFGRITQKVLTPKEQQEAVQGVTSEQQANQQQTIKEIETRKAR
jgi:dissimilatory sulfite reductase (desulfoviridin) alpha/beta subunit